MSRRLLAVLVLLAACAAPPAGVWRDLSQPIASAALFDPARFAGEWHVVARYPRAADRDCPAEVMDYDGAAMRWRCLGAGGAVLRDWQGPVQPQVYPGRLTTDLGDFGLRDFWVLWVDWDYRTAVIGTPSGTAGYVLNRDPAIPGDRMTAAREMLDFNGYDPAGLVTLR
ncbi:MAG: lipocalin family protein [Rubellimicrobium sp.]|nr:lipocalin family protein [Rubellimicrobium sp.]